MLCNYLLPFFNGYFNVFFQTGAMLGTVVWDKTWGPRMGIPDIVHNQSKLSAYV